MLALSIDTAANLCAVAVSDQASGQILAAISHDIGRGHAEMLMDTIEQCLTQAQKPYSDIDKIITTIGPGSFTGVRVGMAAARAIGLGLSKPVVGISNLQACAAHALQLVDTNGDAKTKQPIWVILDARRDEVYFQQFDGSDPTSKPMVCRIDELVANADFAIGSDVMLCGSGAQLFLSAMAGEEVSANHPIAHHLATAPIEVVASLGMAAAVSEDRPEPLYLRGADAKQQAGFAVSRINGSIGGSIDENEPAS